MTLKYGLAAIRITTVAFLAPWIAIKFVNPQATQGIAATFYGIEGLPLAGTYLLGIAQAALVILFLLGLFKLVSYGSVLVMHGVSTLSTIPVLLAPLENNNALFWAAVPTLAAIATLFFLRKEDTFLTVSGGQSQDEQVTSAAQ
ncbi:MAG: DoxX protein [Geminicoccaceae bacterium]